MPSLAASFSWGTVLVATAVAAGFLVLVTTPLALVGAAARGRLRTAWLRNPFAGVLGRNRTRAERRLGDDVLPTWAAVALGVGIVTVATLLGVGVGLEARYVRLAVAVLAGCSAVLTAAVVVATPRPTGLRGATAARSASASRRGSSSPRSSPARSPGRRTSPPPWSWAPSSSRSAAREPTPAHSVSGPVWPRAAGCCTP
ncbi:hypothetical protein [Curtobacterium sp. Csp1]|uniref:hypothetical protein n=1 Tax=Curtobacterium sp. Csp1 TaxID=2495429 RepID=UPI0020C6BBD1|nr:hypothetical protein [Curtobacterium sp. Csp1]